MHPFTDQLTSLIDEMRQYIDQDSAYSADDAVRKLLDQAQRSLAHGDVEHAIELIGDIYLDVGTDLDTHDDELGAVVEKMRFIQDTYTVTQKNTPRALRDLLCEISSMLDPRTKHKAHQ